MIKELDRLENEAIYIMREVASEAEKPVMLYSIGKDSSVMLRLAEKVGGNVHGIAGLVRDGCRDVAAAGEGDCSRARSGAERNAG